MANGNIEVAKAFVTIVPSMEGSQATITKELTGVTNEASEKAGEEGGAKFGDKFAGALKGATAAIGASMAAVTGAAIATGKAFLDSANEVAEYGDQVDKMSQKMGISAQSYQEWDFIMQHAGASIDSLKGSMKTLATAAETGSEAFDALGISQEQIAAMSQEDLFAATIASLQNIEDETTRTYLASQVLGKGATELGALFNMSASETEALRQQVHDLGGIMSDEAVKDAAAYQDAMQNMQTSLDGVKRNMMSEFLPGITSVMDGLSKVFSGNGGVEEVQSGLESIVQNITAMAPTFFTLAEALVTSLLEGFAPMLPQLVSSIFTFLINGLTTITGLIPQLLPVIQTGIQGLMQAVFTCLPIIIQALLQLTTDLVAWMASGDNITQLVNGLFQIIGILAEGIATALPILLPALVSIIGQVSASLLEPDNIEMILNSVLIILGSVVVALINSIPELIGALTKINDNIGKTVQKFAGGFLTSVGQWFTNVINKFKEFGTNLIQGIWSGISSKVDWIKEKIMGFGDSVTSAIKGIFGIASPSKLWRDEVGSMLALGIGEGFTDTMGDVEKDMTNSLDGLTGSMTADVRAYGAGGASVLGSSNTYNGGNISINVYGAQGQDVNALAEVISVKLEEMTRRKGLVYG